MRSDGTPPAPTRGARPPGLAGRAFALWALLREYLGMSGRRREPVDDPASFARFLQTRASHVAQTALYGYLRTRAGMRYPELFDNDAFVASINIAKWHIYLACLSDLSIYAGGLLHRYGDGSAAQVCALMQAAVDEVLTATGTPLEAGEAFGAHADAVRARVAGCDWTTVSDDEAAFSESPAALVRWAPIVDELKALDEEIVKNSIRFRWQEVRRDLRRDLHAASVLAAGGG